MKLKQRMNKAGKALRTMYNNGVKKITLFYTRRVNGKDVPNYMRIGLTAAVVAAAGYGAYKLYMHKKHGPVIKKVEDKAVPPMMGQ